MNTEQFHAFRPPAQQSLLADLVPGGVSEYIMSATNMPLFPPSAKRQWEISICMIKTYLKATSSSHPVSAHLSVLSVGIRFSVNVTCSRGATILK